MNMLDESSRKRERLQFKVVLVCLFAVIVMLIAEHCKASEDAESLEDALWLARSCVGEAGWDSVETGECAAILHIYKKRGELNGKGTLWTAKKYSAAIKPGRHHRNTWVRYLDGTRKPKHWPANLKWERYSEKWNRAYWYAVDFLNGEVEDPLPDAMHYGSRIDAHRVPSSWKRIKAPFRNWFWSVGGKK